MPHLTVEFTNNLAAIDPASVLTRLNSVLIASGQFEGPDIKSRAMSLDCHRVGDGEGQHGFVHVTLALLSGRTPEIKKQLTSELLMALVDLRREAGWDKHRTQLSVDIRDLEREFYVKG